jgi:hypothetical protein
MRNKNSNQQRNNQIIYAKLGESINISCWFDPALFNTNLNKYQGSGYSSYSGLDSANGGVNTNYNLFKLKRRRFAKNGHLKTSSSSPSIIVVNRGNHMHRKVHHFNSKKSLDYISGANNEENAYFKASSSSQNNQLNSLNEENEETLANSISNDNMDNENSMIKYELDWYFLDRQGRMNIISYGNRTSKDKYRTFIARNIAKQMTNNHQSSDTWIRSSSELGYSSSALYSQASKALSGSNGNGQQENSASYYTYYLNTRIESEDDEGVYQCMNPDLPSFILRNVTVIVESKFLNFCVQFFLKLVPKMRKNWFEFFFLIF